MAPDWFDKHSQYTSDSFPFLQLGKLAAATVGAVTLAVTSGVADVLEANFALPIGAFNWLTRAGTTLVTRILEGAPVASQLSGHASDGVRRVGGVGDALAQAFRQTANSGIFDGFWGFVLAVAVVLVLGYAVAWGVTRLVQ
ncbi:hypothetical protein G9C85_00180 [Halorubellus sp. JP-L1]|uniref:hypothetical protein n=1 Tax=Halorubellus sp. JP-L1 TaxID=2715753 RepID=UPI00140B35AE|nr:hypothetical protein [Halorubellus sp. JP-L1]NHN40055.1 hypothetical protein [Halorubellus sp. JP-L1]